ncbi:MAG TPA: 2Fe-2S iron-sulfur cluster-binding protein [Stellaceae bacterium]|nr:2Fe-2S iron-sulfur cluster-binding protein [Stellaceae bacterium]
MTAPDGTILIDDIPVPFKPGQTILEAALEADVFIPHLCFHPELGTHGSCRVCNVVVNGRHTSACTMKAASGQEIEVNTWLGESAQAFRRTLVQMLFVEGNHFCPSCEKSGNCQLQALGYDSEMMTPHFVEFFPNRPVDASHPDVLLDLNRCIQCELCVRASRDVDGKSIFALAGRGMASHLVVNSPTGKLGDTNFSVTDKAAHVCPVGAIIVKRVGFAVAIGERRYDLEPISEEATSRREVEEAK